MPSSDTAVFGIFADADAAGTAVDHLLSSGFSASVISVLLLDPNNIEGNPNAASGVIADAGLGLLDGLGEFAIPEVGPLMAAGPIVTTLLGLAGEGRQGGLVAALIDMGIPEYEAKLYESAVKEGGTLFSVRCEGIDQTCGAKTILDEAGAHAIASTIESIEDDTSADRSGSVSANGKPKRNSLTESVTPAVS